MSEWVCTRDRVQERMKRDCVGDAKRFLASFYLVEHEIWAAALRGGNTLCTHVLFEDQVAEVAECLRRRGFSVDGEQPGSTRIWVRWDALPSEGRVTYVVKG